MHGAGLEERGRATTFSYELSHKLAPASSFNRLGDAAAGATLTAGFGGSRYDLVEGEVAHSCAHGPGPHRIKVVVVKKDNDPKLIKALTEIARKR